MKYRLSSVLAIAMLVISVGSISRPAIGKESAGPIPQSASSNTIFEGILVVKESHGDIFIKSDNGHQRRLRVKSRTSITRNGKPAAFEDLQIRDRIILSYDSEHVVVELHATGS